MTVLFYYKVDNMKLTHVSPDTYIIIFMQRLGSITTQPARDPIPVPVNKPPALILFINSLPKMITEVFCVLSG